MKIEIQLNHYDLRVLIDELLHIYILRDEFIGFQTWADDESMFVIEYYTKTNKITTQWNNKEKWEQLVKSLNEKL